MAQIGSFTRNEDGVYNGEIRTLTLRVKATIRPVEREHDKAPDHRVSAGGVEFGAGWTKAARETGAEYLSLKLDDPSFPAPIYATLTQGDNGERSEEHTSELQSLMRISYAVFCLKKKNNKTKPQQKLNNER